MEHLPTNSFWEDYRDLPDEIKEKAKKAFELFKDNPRHPSFQTHKILGTGNPTVFEGYIDMHYRFTFYYDEDAIVYLAIGRHSIIDQASRS